MRVKQSGGPVDHRRFDVRWGAASVGCECHTEEFCVKVLKLEIMNSRKLFNYFSGTVPRTIETAQPVSLSLGGLKMAHIKIDRTTLDL